MEGPARQTGADRRNEIRRQHVREGAPRQRRLDRIDDLADIGRIGDHQERPGVGGEHHGIGLDRARDVDGLTLAQAGIHRLGAHPPADRRHDGLARVVGPEALHRIDGEPCHRAAPAIWPWRIWIRARKGCGSRPKT